jgi:hypothetical protein
MNNIRIFPHPLTVSGDVSPPFEDYILISPSMCSAEVTHLGQDGDLQSFFYSWQARGRVSIKGWPMWENMELFPGFFVSSSTTVKRRDLRWLIPIEPESRVIVLLEVYM